MPSTSKKTVLHPTVLWAQRDSILYVTVEVEDMKMDELKMDDKSMHIKGSNGTGSVDYECTLDFYGEVDAAKYRRIESARHVELVIPKASSGWWPRLLKENAKVPWVKVDFNKWKDEDDDEYSAGGGGMGGMGGGGGDFDFNDYMGKMGGAGGMGKDGQFGGAPGIDDDLEGDEDDSEDDMPELEDTESGAKSTGEGVDKPGPSTTAAVGKSGEETVTGE